MHYSFFMFNDISKSALDHTKLTLHYFRVIVVDSILA